MIKFSADVKVKRSLEKVFAWLMDLYNQRLTWLDLAHKKVDEAVFAAYGWKPDLSDEEILEKLLAFLPSLDVGSASLNLERSKADK